jgi:hypothetical protein
MPQQTSKEIQQQWKDNILKQRASGLSIASWCRQNNIIVSAFYYWRDKFFPQAILDHSDFTEIPNAKKTAISDKKPGISIEYQGIRILLDQQFDPSALKQCLEILKALSC